MHEQLDRDEEPEALSERGFGLTIAAGGAIVALWPLLKGGEPRWWVLGAALVILTVSVFAAWTLRPLNRLWSGLGLLLNQIVSPVVLGSIFYGVLTPLGVIKRARGKDLFRLRFDRSAPSYWIAREPPGPKPKTMSRQF